MLKINIKVFKFFDVIFENTLKIKNKSLIYKTTDLGGDA